MVLYVLFEVCPPDSDFEVHRYILPFHIINDVFGRKLLFIIHVKHLLFLQCFSSTYCHLYFRRRNNHYWKRHWYYYNTIQWLFLHLILHVLKLTTYLRCSFWHCLVYSAYYITAQRLNSSIKIVDSP